MITSHLFGGLGNQMFQYAFGYAVSKNLKTQLYYYFDPSIGSIKRNFELDIFKLSGKEVSNRLIFFLYKLAFPQLREQGFSYTNYSNAIKNNSTLSGYWQSEKYFIKHQKEIRSEFSFKNALVGKNKNITNRITNSNSVSVHIRRGDYVENKKTNAHHGVCSKGYYQKAMSVVETNIKNPSYFFFSDDPEWARNNLSSKFESTYIDWNTGNQSYIDMQLMSLCKHNIIANSSFSWWGAWLNNNPKKKVITPKKWFANKSINTSDLIPPKWLKI